MALSNALENCLWGLAVLLLLTHCASPHSTVPPVIPNAQFEQWEKQAGTENWLPQAWKSLNTAPPSGIVRYPNEGSAGYHLYLGQQGELNVNCTLTIVPRVLEVVLKSFLDGDQATIKVMFFDESTLVEQTIWVLKEDFKTYTRLEVPLPKIKGRCDRVEIHLIGPQSVRSVEAGIHIRQLLFK